MCLLLLQIRRVGLKKGPGLPFWSVLVSRLQSDTRRFRALRNGP